MLLLSITGYLLVTAIIGIWASRLVKTSGDFVLAGRSLPLFLSASALFATWFGSETILGASSEFAEHGLLGVIEDPFGGALCLILYGVFFAIPLYKMNLLTLGDLFKVKFGPKAELLAAIFLIPSYFSWITAQLVALGLILHSIAGIEVFTGVIISAVIVTAYTSVGGMWAVSITDFIQSIIIVCGLIALVAVIISEAGGVTTILENTPEGFFNFFPEAKPQSILTYIAAWMTIGLGSIPSQDIFQRAMASKTAIVARNSSILGGILYLFIACLPLFIALAAKVLHPGLVSESEQALLPALVLHHMPLYMQIVFFGALLSAILSTTSAAILAPASILSENLIKPAFGNRLTDKQFLMILRCSVVGIAAFATIMAFWRTNIYELVGLSSALSLVSIFVPMVAAVYSNKRSELAAIGSMIAGMIAWTIFTISDHWIPPILPGLLISLLAYLTLIFSLKKK